MVQFQRSDEQALAAVTLLGVLGGELLTRFIPEVILRKVAAALLVGMELLMLVEKSYLLNIWGLACVRYPHTRQVPPLY